MPSPRSLIVCSLALGANALIAPGVTRRPLAPTRSTVEDTSQDSDDGIHIFREGFVADGMEGVRRVYSRLPEFKDCAQEECDATELEAEDGWAQLRRQAWREEIFNRFAEERAESIDFRKSMERRMGLLEPQEKPAMPELDDIPEVTADDVEAFRNLLSARFASNGGGDGITTERNVPEEECL